MADGGKQAQGNVTKQAEKSKMKGTPDGVEQQAGSFTKQLYGYMPRFHRGAGQPPPHTKSQKRIYSMCLNLRDVGANMPALMKPGIVFRSSELLRYSRPPPALCLLPGFSSTMSDHPLSCRLDNAWQHIRCCVPWYCWYKGFTFSYANLSIAHLANHCCLLDNANDDSSLACAQC